jgi:hypothetical protein
MATETIVVYGDGGFDPNKPNYNVIATETVTLDPITANVRDLQAKAEAALANNIAALALPDPTTGNDTYLAIVNPTQAQAVAQVASLTRQNNALVAQVTALTRQVNALIRLAQGLLDSTNGT